MLEWHSRKTEPLNVGNLLKDHMRRFYPLDVYHIAGSVGDKDRRLENMDAVTAIELIEHLHPETLEEPTASRSRRPLNPPFSRSAAVSLPLQYQFSSSSVPVQ